MTYCPATYFFFSTGSQYNDPYVALGISEGSLKDEHYPTI